ncbi:MAG: ATP-binding protein [Betaproteobacteria bacterium]
MRSIRRQLLVSLLATIAFAGLIAAAGIYLTVQHEFNEVFDYELKQVALSFREDSLGMPIPPPILEEDDDLVIEIWDRAGNLVYTSDQLPVLPPRVQAGYSSIDTTDDRWRVFNTESHGYTIQVAQSRSARHALAGGAAGRTMIPILLLIAALGVVIWFIIGRGLRPLNKVADAVGQRSASAMQPLSSADLPAEVRPLVVALNHLLGRLEGALSTHRTFIADAAHELRTPLTAVQLQIQIARRARTEEERADAFGHLEEGVKRSIHLVQQLLTLAREEPDLVERNTGPVELAQLARQAVADHVSLAEAKDIDIGVEGEQPVWITGNPEALRAMLGNLIDNAIRYIQRGGKIDVGAHSQGNQAVLTITDNGPGIAPAFRERAFDRFWRGEGAREIGSGLGLAIVKNVVDHHGATVSLEPVEHDRGLRVMVRFPAT